MSSFTTDLKYELTDKTDQGRSVYRLTEQFAYRVGSLDDPLVTINVPVGYETDLASIPWPFRLIFKPDRPCWKADVGHDYIYTNMPQISRIIADSIFLEAMLVLGINVIVAYTFYLAVRIFQQAKGNTKVDA